MISSISRNLARQIVETIHEVCGYSINFINPEGIIYASSNEDRIGLFHEIGRQAAQTGQVIEVAANDQYPGTQKGINIPILYHHQVMAVIGISGEPDEVRRFARLAERISRIILHEQEISERHRTMEEQKLYVLRSFISGEIDNLKYFRECLSSFHFDTEDVCRIIILENRELPSVSVAQMETQIMNVFASAGDNICAYIYPDRYVGLIKNSAFDSCKEQFRSALPSLKIAAGCAAPLLRSSCSWETACSALDTIRESDGHFIVFDDLTLEILLSGIPEIKKAEFSSKVLKDLKPEDLRFLSVYYEENMSLTATAKRLYLHKNTVQQRLLRIEKITGADPRRFRDAVLFYLALLSAGHAALIPDAD